MTPHRSPGGQPGNQNARKHGFYSNVLTLEQQILLAPAKKLGGLDEELALARAKLNSIMVNAPRNYNVLVDAIALVARLTGMKKRLSHQSSRRFERALEIVLKDSSYYSGKPGHRRSQPNGGAVSPPSQENDPCVI